jgi:hypothetical protein
MKFPQERRKEKRDMKISERIVYSSMEKESRSIGMSRLMCTIRGLQMIS